MMSLGARSSSNDNSSLQFVVEKEASNVKLDALEGEPALFSPAFLSLGSEGTSEVIDVEFSNIEHLTLRRTHSEVVVDRVPLFSAYRLTNQRSRQAHCFSLAAGTAPALLRVVRSREWSLL